ncbi:aldehyde dehydrogenase (NADP(+)) [Nocardia africana]|uniref:Aldehyde dehydrogenase (NADP(+)) n=1 Tax=Nocardia africana TaxID=134964 RepID=A0ABW6NUX3_9NOCA
MNTIDSIDPSTGAVVESVSDVTTHAQVSELAAKAKSAASMFAACGRPFRARLLRAIADELDEIRPDVVTIGMRETALHEARLNAELTRTVYQARLFADVVDDGAYLEATIDHATNTPMGPGPDLRRMLVPIGPVAVFGASNFPLAFSVPGGDTISALAAGCPVVIKAHSSHPALSLLTFEAMTRAARSMGAPDGLLGILFGTSAGARLVADPAVTAVGFTGSLDSGKALMGIIASRKDPIPFYGELSSLNPVIVTPGAAASRGSEIASGLVASVTGSGGQLCTKPGLVLVPNGADGDSLVAEAARLMEQSPAATLLTARISTAYERIIASLKTAKGAAMLAEGGKPSSDGFSVTPRLVQVDQSALQYHEVDECFGPATVIARYSVADLAGAIAVLPASLTGTIHAEDDEIELVSEVSSALQSKAGRLLFNSYPTGVLVSWGQHHGGPWPSTNNQHTSVGATSIRRWLRPMAWQSAPSEVLPAELHDGYTSVVRRVDGRIVCPH